MEYASKGLAGTALGFGIGGAAMSLANGGLGNLLGDMRFDQNDVDKLYRYIQEA